MKKLEVKQMEVIEGGCSGSDNKVLAVASFAATVGGLLVSGPVGLALFGPTAIGTGVAGLVCAFS